MEAVRYYHGATHKNKGRCTRASCSCAICGNRIKADEKYVSLNGNDIHEGCIRPEVRKVLNLLGYEPMAMEDSK